MMKFKVGDKVKIIKEIATDDAPAGNVYEIIKVVSGNMFPYYLNVNVFDRYADNYSEDQLELVKSKGRPKKIKYIVTYDVENIDPYEVFDTKKALVKFLKENENITNVCIYKVEKEMSYKRETRIKLE